MIADMKGLAIGKRQSCIVLETFAGNSPPSRGRLGFLAGNPLSEVHFTEDFLDIAALAGRQT